MMQRRMLWGACGHSRSPLVSLTASLATSEPRACLERAALKGEGWEVDNLQGMGHFERAQTLAASKGEGARHTGACSMAG